MTPRLVLASQSPRRRELLGRLGVAFDVRPADTDESLLPGEDPRDYVLRVAREKARAVAGDIVLAADTVVVLDGQVIGKPRDPEDARRMLRSLSGVTHEVLTGVCVRRNAGEDARSPLEDRAGSDPHDDAAHIRQGGPAETPVFETTSLVSTHVLLAKLTAGEIEWYVGTREPLDKAGAYAIQGAGGAFVVSVQGSVSNVIGLPLAETAELLRRAGLPLFSDGTSDPAEPAP